MKKAFLFVALLMALSFSLSFAQNLVVNGDLELWTGGVPDGWGLVENISQESTTVHSGSYSAAHTSAATTKKFNQEISGVEEGEEYTISYWYYDNDATARTRIWSYWLSGGTTLPDNADELRPSVYSTDNPGWLQFNVVLTAPAGADAFRFEVRVYQENSSNGGNVYYDDFEFSGDITIYPEPTNYPTNFVATPAGLSITLAWVDAAGAQLPSGYVIMAGTSPSLPIPVDGTPVPNDGDLSDGSGALNVGFGVQTGSFANLEGNTPYYFAIYPYTNSGSLIDFKTDGTAPTSSASTASFTTIESENFDVSWGNWTTISVVGDQVWDRDNTFGINNTACARISGYSGGPLDNDDWLISPPMNFNDFENEILEFYNAKNYTGPDLECVISTDYDGGDDPYAGTWENLTFVLCPGSWTWTYSGAIDISGYSGDAVYIAFHYTCNTTESATWEIDDIMITGEENAVPDPEPSNYPTVFTATVDGTDITLTWTDAVGTQLPDKYIIFGGISTSLPVPVDGTPVANDPDLSDGSAALNVLFGVQEAFFGDLQPATTYYFSIYPYTNSGASTDYKTDGTAPTAEETTENVVTVTIETENFDVSWGNWTTISVIGDQVWDRDNAWGIGGTPCASMSGYSGQAYDNEDWLISPAMNFNNYINEIISFQNAKNYTGNDMIFRVSTNYDGGDDPNSATWTDIPFTMSAGGFAWTFSGEIDLSAYNGTAVYVAFYFTSTSSASATWEVDDIVISGEEEATVYPEPSNYPTSFAADATGTTILVTWTDAVGTQLPDQYILFAGTNSSLPVPVDGTPVADDLDLTDGSGALNVVYGTQEAEFAGLEPGEIYYFVIFPYTNSGNNTDYKTDGTAPMANAETTLTPEPSNYPTSFDANPASNSIALTWTDATGTQLPENYIVFAGLNSSLPVPADGTPVANDTDLSDGSGAINIVFGVQATSFGNLAANTTYYFSIYPYTNSGSNIDYKNDGTAPTAEGTTVEPVIVTIESENFDEDWGNWSPVSVAGDQAWDRDNTFGVNNTPCARMSGFSGSSNANEDWLISPSLDLDNYLNEVIVFMNAKNYTGNDLELMVSTDYDGGGDPTSATWTELTYTKSPGTWEWTNSGEVVLSSFNGSAVYVAFKYTSTASASATWEVDDIEIKGEEDLSSDNQIALDDLLSIYPNPAQGTLNFNKPEGKFSDIKLITSSGIVVDVIKHNAGIFQYDISGLSEGIYLVLFTDQSSGQTLTRKLIIK